MSKATLDLINEVRDHPILYDTTLNCYKNTYDKKLVWQKIAEKIGSKDGETVSWKWKNLRDGYAKYLRGVHSPADSENQKLLNWRWAEHMHFMEPFMRITRDMNESKKLDAPVTIKRQRDYSFEADVTQEDNSSDADLGQSNSKRICAVETPEFNIENITSVRPEQSLDVTERLDKIDYLFLNYADTFKKLSPRKQAILKLQMAKMFAEAELEALSDPIKVETIL